MNEIYDYKVLVVFRTRGCFDECPEFHYVTLSKFSFDSAVKAVGRCLRKLYRNCPDVSFSVRSVELV